MDSAAQARDLIYGNIDIIMNNAQRLQASKTVTLDTLLDDGFMRRHTDFASIKEMFVMAGQSEVSEAALDDIPDYIWQDIVAKYTIFDSWDKMFETASQRYVRACLLDGIDTGSDAASAAI